MEGSVNSAAVAKITSRKGRKGCKGIESMHRCMHPIVHGHSRHFVLSRVSLHSRLQCAFNRPIHKIATREKPLFRVVGLSRVFVDSKKPALFAAGILQPTDGSNGAKFVPVQVKVLAFEARDVTVTRLRKFLLVESLNDVQRLFLEGS